MAKSAQSIQSGPTGYKPYKLKKGEAYMSPKQLDHFRGVLGSWRQQLMEESDDTVSSMHENENYADLIDRASQEMQLRLKLRIGDRERKLIHKIEQALDRLEAGEYGYCGDCGAEIGVRRLEARPTATQCIDCKTFDEIREKQTSA